MAPPAEPASASEEIDAIIAGIGDWRGEVLARMRQLILGAGPQIVEEIKWRKPTNPAGVPVWSHEGIICTGQAFKGKVKITFANGAPLDDPAGVFNAGLEGNKMRALDIHEGDEVDEEAFQALVRAAAEQNAS